MIKTMGFRVSPDAIADVLQASGAVTEAAVVTEPDPQRGERIVACVVLRENETVEHLRRFCGVELPRYMQPVRYVVMAALPRNLSGKHDIQQLKAALFEPTPTVSS
jgi:acyl-coenzyme A synthetase/AMP-(fatty) acid ligase